MVRWCSNGCSYDDKGSVYSDAGDRPGDSGNGLVFAPAPLANVETVLAIPGYPLLASGSRPLTDLQFTTVVPALRKLATLLTPRDLLALEARIAAGEKPLAAARWLCLERRWL
jgi:hypothetical protein